MTGSFLCSDNEIQDLFRECDDDPTCKGQKSVGTLGRIMALQGQSYLYDAPSQQDQTYRADKPEYEFTQVVNHLYGIPR